MTEHQQVQQMHGKKINSIFNLYSNINGGGIHKANPTDLFLDKPELMCELSKLNCLKT